MKKFKALVTENRLVKITDKKTGKTIVYNVLDFIPGQRHYNIDTAEYPVYLLNDIDNQMRKYNFINY